MLRLCPPWSRLSILGYPCPRRRLSTTRPLRQRSRTTHIYASGSRNRGGAGGNRTPDPKTARTKEALGRTRGCTTWLGRVLQGARRPATATRDVSFRILHRGELTDGAEAARRAQS